MESIYDKIKAGDYDNKISYSSSTRKEWQEEGRFDRPIKKGE